MTIIFIYQVSNYKIGHDFEVTTRNLLNSQDILAQEIKVTQGDGGVDIIATYKEHLILIQCKSIVSPITYLMMKNFEASVSRYPTNTLNIIVYDGEKLQETKNITPKAKSYMNSSKYNIKVSTEKTVSNLIKDTIDNYETEGEIEICNYSSDFLKLSDIEGKNVTISKIIIRKNKKRYSPY
jgi:hypothetical protein